MSAFPITFTGKVDITLVDGINKSEFFFGRDSASCTGVAINSGDIIDSACSYRDRNYSDVFTG